MPLTVRLEYKTETAQPLRLVDIDIGFHGPMGQLLFLCKASLAHGWFETLPAGRHQISCTIPKLPLSPAEYRIKLWAGCASSHSDRIENAASLLVEPGDFYGTGFLPRRSQEGIVMVEHSWAVGDPKPAGTPA